MSVDGLSVSERQRLRELLVPQNVQLGIGDEFRRIRRRLIESDLSVGFPLFVVTLEAGPVEAEVLRDPLDLGRSRGGLV